MIIDDSDPSVTRKGFKTHSTSSQPFVGSGYHHDDNVDKVGQEIRYPFSVPVSGKYEVRLAYSPHSNRATKVPATIQHATGTTTVHVNQQQPPPINSTFTSLGIFEFKKDSPASVTLSNHSTDGHVIADAIQVLPHKPGRN